MRPTIIRKVESDGRFQSAIRFAAWEGLYFAEKLGISLWQRFGNLLSLEETWSEAAMAAVVAEAMINLQEPWYIENPYHRAINLIRTAVYFRVCPNWRLLPQGYRKCLCNLEDTYWLKWRNSASGIRNGVLGGVNVDQIAGWMKENFCR